MNRRIDYRNMTWKVDNKYYLYPVVNEKVVGRRKHLITCSRHDLILVAWKIGVTNPDGFNRYQFRFISQLERLRAYKRGWKHTNTSLIRRYIYNHLYDNNGILDKKQRGITSLLQECHL